MPRIAPGSLDFNMSPEKIILFDIPSRDPVHTWSLNPWKSKCYAIHASWRFDYRHSHAQQLGWF